MCNPLTNTFPKPIPPPKTAEELRVLKEKIEADKLQELKRQHEMMGFIKDNMR